ncbi:hypothetical protein ERO13_D03G102750v2 [Gossypium hirsutum]|nr:hypothetical protein ERO13_D03G102750v2 [Gossypium hirsutum]
MCFCFHCIYTSFDHKHFTCTHFIIFIFIYSNHSKLFFSFLFICKYNVIVDEDINKCRRGGELKKIVLTW